MPVRSLPPPRQLELPLDYSRSDADALSRNLGRSKATRARRPQASLATIPAKRVRPYTVQASTSSLIHNLNEQIRQGQRFSLTSHVSSIITNVNAKCWRGYVSALPPQREGPDAQSGEGRAHERRGSLRSLQANPLERYGRRAELPSLRLPRRLHFSFASNLQMPRLRTSIQRHVGDDLRRPQARAPHHPSRGGDLRERREGPYPSWTVNGGSRLQGVDIIDSE